MIQRMLLVVLAIAGIAVGIIFVTEEREEKMQRQWEALQVERLMGNICRSGSCTYEEYMLCHDALNYFRNLSFIEIETYQKEKDMSGGNYYYMTSWEEIKEMFYRNGEVCFSEESVIVIRVSRKNMVKSVETKFYNIVSGKD